VIQPHLALVPQLLENLCPNLHNIHIILLISSADQVILNLTSLYINMLILVVSSTACKMQPSRAGQGRVGAGVGAGVGARGTIICIWHILASKDGAII
jgi:hypothetical protein